MKKQKVIFSLSMEGGEVTVSLDFKPGLVGDNLYRELSQEDKYLHNTAGKVACFVMEALKKDNEK